jgi:hypothetical protein
MIFRPELKLKIMKAKLFVVLALMAVIFQGCIVKSLHPFYTEDKVIFKPELIDTWEDQDGGKWFVKPVKEKPNSYEMRWNKNGKDALFIAHLFTLEGEMYFDFIPLSRDEDESLVIFDLHLLPTHSVAKVEVLNEREVHIKWFNEQWLRSLFDNNRIKISHEAVMDEAPKDEHDKYYVLTASTEELQKFIIKYGHEDKAFDNNDTMWLRLKRAI